MLFEIKVNYQRQTGEDNPGLVKEKYLVNGETPADVQNRLLEHIQAFVFGELEVPQVVKRKYFEIFPDENAENWYEGKVEMITIDDDVERRRVVPILIEADSLSDAVNVLKDKLSCYDCEIVQVAKSKFVEVLK